MFTANRIIDAIKVSQLTDRVAHRVVILPALSASGVDREALAKETGFHARFGPVYARDIPAYLNARKKTEAMRRFDFGPRHRLDMFLPMNFPVYFLVALVLALVAPRHLLGFTVLFWSAVAALYVLVDVIPGQSGWAQAMYAASIVVLAWGGIDWYREAAPLAHWGWLLATFAVFFGAGFDLAGTITARRSDAELMMQRLGFERFGFLFSAREIGVVHLDRERCRGCRTCTEICPVGVFADLDADKKISFRDQQACFACGACVKQCSESALSLSVG